MPLQTIDSADQDPAKLVADRFALEPKLAITSGIATEITMTGRMIFQLELQASW